MFEWYVLSVTGNAYICLMLRDQGKRKREPRKLIFLFRCEKIEYTSGNTVSSLEGLSRGYALDVCFGVCFGGMLRGLLRKNFITWNLLHI